MLEKSSTIIDQLATVHVCDWLTKVWRIYEPSCLLLNAIWNKPTCSSLCLSLHFVILKKIEKFEQFLFQPNRRLTTLDLEIENLDEIVITLGKGLKCDFNLCKKTEEAAVKIYLSWKNIWSHSVNTRYGIRFDLIRFLLALLCMHGMSGIWINFLCN